MRAPSQRLVFFAAALAVLVGSHAAAQNRFARKPAPFERDQKRMAHVERIRSLEDLLASGSHFTGTRVGKDTPWLMHEEGKRDFSVDLGNNMRITGMARRYNNPFKSVTKLHQLWIEKDGKKVALLPENVPTNLAFSTHFWNGVVTWHGPSSRFALFALLHELGHAHDWNGMSQEEKSSFEQIYNDKSDDKPLSHEHKRTMVGFERRA